MGSSFVRLICCAAAVLLVRPALAEYATFADTDAPPAFKADYLVTDESMAPEILTVTLAGDCTLGGTESAARKDGSLIKTVKELGLSYPFAKLAPLFAKDDLTLVNLEGVLSDSAEGENTEKEFAFRGPAGYAQMLSLGSVEAVNLSNNHFDDYGSSGRKATLQALNENGIAYAGNEWLCVYKTDHGKIGLAGTLGNLTKDKQADIKRQIALLREAGCQIVIFSLHAGQEYAQKHNGFQQDVAHFLIDAGADVVAGHHPHVVQGVEIYKNRLIFYSLGNCVFGGNHDPRETDAMAVRVSFDLEDDRLKGMQASLHPFLFTGILKRNTFQPLLLNGSQAGAVTAKVLQDTAFPLSEFKEDTGVLLPYVPAE